MYVTAYFFNLEFILSLLNMLHKEAMNNNLLYSIEWSYKSSSVNYRELVINLRPIKHISILS